MVFLNLVQHYFNIPQNLCLDNHSLAHDSGSTRDKGSCRCCSSSRISISNHSLVAAVVVEIVIAKAVVAVARTVIAALEVVVGSVA